MPDAPFILSIVKGRETYVIIMKISNLFSRLALLAAVYEYIFFFLIERKTTSSDRGADPAFKTLTHNYKPIMNETCMCIFAKWPKHKITQQYHYLRLYPIMCTGSWSLIHIHPALYVRIPAILAFRIVPAYNICISAGFLRILRSFFTFTAQYSFTHDPHKRAII